MSEYQYYEFLALDRPLDELQQAEVRELSTRADITATSFINEYHRGDFRGDPQTMVERFYDAHLYLANWGSRRLIFRLPSAVLDLDVAEQYCVDPYVAAWTSEEHLLLDLGSEDESGDGDWVGDVEGLLAAIVGVRAELAAGDLRPLYLAWLAGYGTWERDENAFDDEEEDVLEPPVPAGLNLLTASQRVLANFLRVDEDLLASAAQSSEPVSTAAPDPDALASWIGDLPSADKDALLLRVAQGHGAGAQAEMLRRFRADEPDSDEGKSARQAPRRTVAQLLDTAADIRQKNSSM